MIPVLLLGFSVASSLNVRIKKSFLQNFSGESVGALLGIVSGFFYAKILGPDIYGVWQTAFVLISYMAFMALGLPFLVKRDYPALVRENKKHEADYIANLVFTFSLFTSGLFCTVLVVWGLLSKGNVLFNHSLWILAAYVLISIPAGYGNIIHKAINDYKTISTAKIMLAVGSVAIIPFIYWFGFYALIFGFAINNVIQSVFYFRRRPIKYKLTWNSAKLKTLLKITFPIFLVTVISTVFGSIDRLLIASMLDFRNVGLYSLSTFLSKPLTLFVSSFAVVLFTQLNEHYGRSTEGHVIDKHVDIPVRFLSGFFPPLIGIGILALPLLTSVFLPKYTGGILAAQINVFSIYFLQMSSFAGNALFVLNKQKLSALSFLIAGTIKTTVSYLGLKQGYGIESVAVASALSYLVYHELMMFFINRSLGRGLAVFFKRSLSDVVCPLIVIAYCTLWISFKNDLSSWSDIQNEWIMLLLVETMLLVITLPFWLRSLKLLKRFR